GHGALELWDSVVELPLMEEGFTATHMCHEERPGVLEGCSDLEAFLGDAHGLAELAEHTQARPQMQAGDDRRIMRPAEALAGPVPLQQLHGLGEQRGPAAV